MWGIPAISTLLVAFLFGVRGTAVGHAARVLELSDKFLEVRRDGVWLVKFYAPWCGHCKKLEPVFNHVAQALHDTNIRVAKVDCTRFPSVASEFNVKGFPTIMFINGDRINVYNGERLTEEIVDYAKKMNGPAVMDTSLRPEDIDGTIFGYYGPKEGPLWDEYEAVAKDYQDTDRYYYFKGKDSNGEARVINKKSTGFILNITDPVRLRDFVASHRFDLYARMTRSNFHRFIQTRKFVAVGVISEDKLGRSPDHHIEFRDLLENHIVPALDVETFVMSWTTATDFMSKFVTAELPTPYLIVINSSNYEHFLLHEDNEEGWTPHRIIQFLEHVAQGTGAVQAQGGNTILVRSYRLYYELKSNLLDMWLGNPILTTVLFGLPLGFFSLIVYSICFADFMDEDDEAAPEGEEYKNHEKKE